MGSYYNDKLKVNIRLWYLYHILENLVLMYLISFVHRCPINKCLCPLEDISPKILPSHLKRNKMQRYKASERARRYVLALSHRETCNSNTDNSDELELDTDYGLDFINAVLLWKKRVRNNN